MKENELEIEELDGKKKRRRDGEGEEIERAAVSDRRKARWRSHWNKIHSESLEAKTTGHELFF